MSSSVFVVKTPDPTVGVVLAGTGGVVFGVAVVGGQARCSWEQHQSWCDGFSEHRRQTQFKDIPSPAYHPTPLNGYQYGIHIWHALWCSFAFVSFSNWAEWKLGTKSRPTKRMYPSSGKFLQVCRPRLFLGNHQIKIWPLPTSPSNQPSGSTQAAFFVGDQPVFHVAYPASQSKGDVEQPFFSCLKTTNETNDVGPPALLKGEVSPKWETVQEFGSLWTTIQRDIPLCWLAKKEP